MRITILPQRYKHSIPPLNLNNVDLVYTDSIKYFCVVLNNNFYDNRDISQQLWCLYASSSAFPRKIVYCTQNVKLHLLESYCLNFYCSVLWCDYSIPSISKFRVAYNNVFRKLLGYGRRDSASSMFVMNTIDTYAAWMRKAYFTFRQRLLSSKNNIVTCINTNTWLRHNYMWQKWDNSLYICHNFWILHTKFTNGYTFVI